MDIKCNDSGQIVIEDNEFSLVEDQEAIAQDITTRLRCWRGEAFLDTTVGLNFVGIVFNKLVSKDTVDSHIRAEIMKVQGVISISGYMSTIDKATRVFTVEISEIATTSGNFKYNLEL